MVANKDIWLEWRIVKSVFKYYGLYYSLLSTQQIFGCLLYCTEQAFRKAGTELLEPYLSFKVYAPREYLSRAYNDAPKYCAIS